VVEDLALSYMEAKGLREDDLLTVEFVEELIETAKGTADAYKVHQMSALYGWFQSRVMMRKFFQDQPKVTSEGYDLEGLRNSLRAILD